MWSDKCLAERGKGKKRAWVWGTPADKWKPSHVETYRKGKDLRVMVWAMFWGEGQRSDLYIMDRDFKSKKHGYSVNSYIEVLNVMLPGSYIEDLYFMQDNAPIHTANKVKKWFEENGIDTSKWPPYSPDLNPIKHAQKKLKEVVMEHFPEVQDAKGESEQDLKNMEEALKKAWHIIPTSFFESLIESIERRIKAVIEADGQHTKYQTGVLEFSLIYLIQGGILVNLVVLDLI